VIVGGGPAGMACALRLSQLIDAHNAKHPDAQLSKENIYVLEKAREIGQHCLSGALLDPRSMRELLPGFEKEAPIDAEVNQEGVYFLTEKGKFKLPVTPPALRDHGNYVISLNRFVKWLGGKVEETGITVFTGFAGSELLFDGNRVAGVRTDDKGVDKQNQRKSNFEPGYDLKAKVTILAEGPRGSLTKQLIARFNLDRDRNPQTYGVGIKELWEVPAGRMAPGEVIYTMGWPLSSKEYGGAWIYGGKDNVVSLGFVIGLDYPDPRLDPHRVLQVFKQHPFVTGLHQGFEHGLWAGMIHAGLQQITGGRGLHNRYPSKPGYQHMKKLSELPPDGGDEAHLLGSYKGDGKLTFDKLTDLYHSGTKHEEDQPAHLIIQDTDVCNQRCIKEFGSPCQHFCPANVYEMVDDATQPNGKRISLNPSNCVHCKTCDIHDPYQVITWVPPEGGGGPNYDGM